MDLTTTSTKSTAFLVLLCRQRAPRRLGLCVFGKLLLFLASLAHTEAYDHSPQRTGRASATGPLPKPCCSGEVIPVIGVFFAATHLRQSAQWIMCGVSHAARSRRRCGVDAGATKQMHIRSLAQGAARGTDKVSTQYVVLQAIYSYMYS